MCGIIGVIQPNKIDVPKTLFDALHRLEYRGYDSVGIAVVDTNGNLLLEKNKGKVHEVEGLVDLETLHAHVGIGHCLHPDTYVLLATGEVKKIKDLPDTIEVLSYDPHDKAIKKSRARVFTHKTDHLYRIKTKRTVILATGHHRFLIHGENGRIKEIHAKDLTAGDTLLLQDSIPTPRESKLLIQPLPPIVAQSLTEQQFYKNGQVNREQKNNFPLVTSPSLMHVLGYLWTSMRVTRQNELTFFDEDVSRQEYYHRVLTTLFPQAFRENDWVTKRALKFSALFTSWYTVNFADTQKLSKGIMDLPSWILQLPHKEVHAFLGGYLDRNARYELENNRLRLDFSVMSDAVFMSLLFLHEDVPISIDENMLYIPLSDSFFEKIVPFMPYLNETLLPTESDWLRKQTKSFGSVREDIIEEIRKVEYSGLVYDLEVDVFHNFFGNGILQHNSRWATHGPPTKENAHPHLDCHGRIAVVHNGIIENFLEIREELQKRGHVFKSDTDTEIIPHLLEERVERGLSIKDALFDISDYLTGAYALVVLDSQEPDTIYCLKRDNPLVIGIGKDEAYCASDIPAFLPYTNKVIILKDDELVVLKASSYELYNAKNRERIYREPQIITWAPDAAQKGGYPHFMLKEIHEQGKVLETQFKLSNQDKEYYEKASELILSAEYVVVVAAGTAFHAGLTAYHGLFRYANIPVIPVIASEFETVMPILNENTVVITVSQSGETLDTIRAAKIAKEKKAKIISVVNVIGSSLTRESDVVIYVHAGPEIGVAATKTFLAQTYALWRLIKNVAEKKQTISQEQNEKITKYEAEIPLICEKIVERTEAKTRSIAQRIKEQKSAFFLGRGINHITALEGALKLKEISYLHAEAYPAGESKHGPIALIEKDFPVVIIAPRDGTRQKITGNIMEMKARGAYLIGIIQEGDEELKKILHEYIEIPKNPTETEFYNTITFQIPLQLIAYYTATAKNLNPDKPRNLAKSVTVE